MFKLLGMSVAAFALATAAFWATMLTDPPKTEAGVTDKFDINDTLRNAPKNVVTQEAGVIACTYVLTDEHRCN